MRCTRCGHPYPQHTLGPQKKCRTRIAYDWDEKTETFGATCPCLCPGWRGEKPGPTECPHEYLPAAPTCVICGYAPAEKSV